MSEPFDETAKLFYQQLFSDWGSAVEIEQEVFSRGRTIDLVIDCPDNQCQLLSATIFNHFRHQNALELKGGQDPLTLKNYNRIMMRAWALGSMDKKNQENALPIVPHPAQRTVTIVCITRPTKILSDSQLGFVSTGNSGTYWHDGQLPVWIINPTELALEPANYSLLPLAKGEKLEQFIDLCLREGLTNHLQLVLDVGLAVNPDTIWKKIMEVTQMSVQIREETWPYIDNFFRQMPEAFRKLPTFQDILYEAERQGRQEGQEIGAIQAQRRLLTRHLQRKFTSVPDEMVQRIEATDSVETLDQWLDQLLVAESLAEMEIGQLSAESE